MTVTIPFMNNVGATNPAKNNAINPKPIKIIIVLLVEKKEVSVMPFSLILFLN